MKRVKIESAEDIEALPEDEWVFVPGGWKFIEEFEPGVRRSRRSSSVRKKPVPARAGSGKPKARRGPKPR